MVKQYGLGL